MEDMKRKIKEGISTCVSYLRHQEGVSTLDASLSLVESRPEFFCVVTETGRRMRTTAAPFPWRANVVTEKKTCGDRK